MATVEEFEHFVADANQVEQAKLIAIKKEPHININAPNGRPRLPHKIRTNIFHGGISQFAVQSLLLRYIATEVEMYDLIRIDNFINHDPWDLRANIHGVWRGVEVRSSFVQQKCAGFSKVSDTLQCIQEKYNLLASYSTANKSGELPKSLFFQVYWTYTQLEAEELYRDVEAGNTQPIECYVVGFATGTLIKGKGTKNSLGQQGASYDVVAIPNAYSCKQLAKLITKS